MLKLVAEGVTDLAGSRGCVPPPARPLRPRRPQGPHRAGHDADILILDMAGTTTIRDEDQVSRPVRHPSTAGRCPAGWNACCCAARSSLPTARWSDRPGACPSPPIHRGHDAAPGQGRDRHGRQFRHRQRDRPALCGGGGARRRRRLARDADRGRRADGEFIPDAGRTASSTHATSPTGRASMPSSRGGRALSAASTSSSTTPPSTPATNLIDTTPEQWARVLAVNLDGLVLRLQAGCAADARPGADRRRAGPHHQHLLAARHGGLSGRPAPTASARRQSRT